MATATDISILEAEKREPGNKNAARRVRMAGKIPAVVYGAGSTTAAVAVDPRQVLRILRSESGHNTIFDLAFDSNRVKAMIVDWQFEPIKGKLLHVDLQRIAMDKKLTVTVPVVLKGEAAGVKQEGGILEQLLREIEVECLPVDIPKSLEVDISHLTFGVEVRVKDLPHSEKLKFLTDENQMIAHITSVKEEVVATPEAVAAEAGAPAEPEVIKKGKQEVEGEEEAEGGDKAKGKAEPKAEKKEKK
jgi:large subunit ribosomal protein L25